MSVRIKVRLLTTTCTLEVRAAIHRRTRSGQTDCRRLFQSHAKATVNVEPAACIPRAKDRSLTQEMTDNDAHSHLHVYIQSLAESDASRIYHSPSWGGNPIRYLETPLYK